MNKIIGLGHRKSTGKSTIARFLATEYRLNHRGSNVVVAGFANKLKDVAHQLYGWAGVQPSDYYEKHPEHKEIIIQPINKSVRQIWIDIGMHMRDIYEDTWLNYLLMNPNYHLLIIPDVRFLNEVQAIKKKGGACIRVIRPDIVDTDDEADCALKDYKDWDWTIINDGSLSELYNGTKDLIERFEL